MCGAVRVLYVLRYYPTLSETFVARELEELRLRGHDVFVARIGVRADGSLLTHVSSVPIVSPGWVDRSRGWCRAPAEEPLRRRSMARAAAVGHWCSRAGIERVHAHFVGEASAWARIIGRVAQIPWSVTAHAVDLYKPFPTARSHLSEARPAIVVSEAGAEHALRRFGSRPRVVRCGVPLPSQVRHDSQRTNPRLITVARWTPKKGLDALIDAVLASTDLRLRLVGPSIPRQSCPRIEVGPLEPSLITPELCRHDLFVLPCRVAPDGDQDGIPVSLMEAMAVGLPVVTTRVGGIAELVDDSVGWLIPPDDPVALRRALSEARDPSERRRRGDAGRRRIIEDGWTVARQVDELLAAWEAA